MFIYNKCEPTVYYQHPLFDMGTNQLLFVFRKYPCILKRRVWGRSNQEVWLVVVLNSFSTNQLGRKLHRCLCKSCKLFLNNSGNTNFVELFAFFETWRFLYFMKYIGKTFYLIIQMVLLCNIQHSTMQFLLKLVFSHQTQAKTWKGN